LKDARSVKADTSALIGKQSVTFFFFKLDTAVRDVIYRKSSPKKLALEKMFDNSLLREIQKEPAPAK